MIVMNYHTQIEALPVIGYLVIIFLKWYISCHRVRSGALDETAPSMRLGAMTAQRHMIPFEGDG